ncbi:DUF6228 family protein [Nonomuraea fuscirosea]|uniref:DUF6228 family protein n=1 Tax=Nonomuraea fuscirosea TaxID=1291556 RepID=UPI0034433AA3
MNHEDHEDQDGPSDVLVRCSRDPAVAIRLSGRRIDDDETVFSVRATAGGLHATVPDVTVSIYDFAGDLAGFLGRLADDFRGWPGTRTWHTEQLTLEAGFHSGGHIELTWSMRPGLGTEATWEVSVTTWIEAGQQLTTVAADVRSFLARP